MIYFPFSEISQPSSREDNDISSSEKQRKYRKQRTVFESDQLKALEDMFSVNAYPSSEEYEALSDRIGIDEPRLRVRSSRLSKQLLLSECTAVV